MIIYMEQHGIGIILLSNEENQAFFVFIVILLFFTLITESVLNNPSHPLIPSV